MTTIHRTLTRAVAALALALAPVGSAGAADVCLEFKAGGFIGVPADYFRATLKGFRVPTPGRCKPVEGWVRHRNGSAPMASDAPMSFVSGNACTSSDGETLHVSLAELIEGHPPRSIRGGLPLPLGSGGDLIGEGYALEAVTPFPCGDYVRLP